MLGVDRLWGQGPAPSWGFFSLELRTQQQENNSLSFARESSLYELTGTQDLVEFPLFSWCAKCKWSPVKAYLWVLGAAVALLLRILCNLRLFWLLLSVTDGYGGRLLLAYGLSGPVSTLVVLTNMLLAKCLCTQRNAYVNSEMLNVTSKMLMLLAKCLCNQRTAYVTSKILIVTYKCLIKIGISYAN